jgi:iron-sulfur cluster assembly protein
MIAITPAAIDQIHKQLTNRHTPNAYLRLGIKGSGCSGFTYVLQYEDEAPRDKDIQLSFDTIKVVMDPKSALYLENTTLDWKSSLLEQGFFFTTPKTKSCGCGKSFSFEG